MTSWLSWVRTLKSLIKELFIPLLLFVLIGLFWYFKGFPFGEANILFAILLFIGGMAWYIRDRESSLEFLVFLSIFLGFYCLYYFQFTFMPQSWLAEILVFIFSFSLFIYLSYEKKLLKNSGLLGLGLSICLLEVFFALSYWPTNPLSKSFIMLALFYAFWYVVTKKENVINYIVLVGAALVVVFATTRWPVI